MNAVHFKLEQGYRIGNYRVEKRLGSGWTAEAYLAIEVPTLVERVIKIYQRFEDTQRISNLKDFEHYCWVVAQLSDIHLLPAYHHMGHVFLKDGDGIGNFYMVQEYIKGEPFRPSACTSEMIKEFNEKVAQVHERGHALGDFSKMNMLISSGSIRMVDCDYGKHNKPNEMKQKDISQIEELFKRSHSSPSRDTDA